MSVGPVSVGIVTGLRAEARIAAAGTGLLVGCGGGDPTATLALIDDFIRDGATALLSFGIAGGLDPALASGTLIVAERVATLSGSYPCDPHWFGQLVSRLPEARRGIVLGLDQILADPRAKALAHADTGALAIDMESHQVALRARENHLPFAVLRAIADPGTSPLPPAALLGLKPDGSPAIGRVLRSLIADPGQIVRLLATARDARRGLRALVGARRRLGPGLGMV